MTTLIIDDEAPARTIVRQYLADFPQVRIVGECADGLAAVESIAQLQPELVFLDIQMPGLNGFEVLGRLEQVPRVVFSTAYDQYALGAFEAGALDYLLKPYDRTRFRRAVERVLQHTAADAPDANLQRLLQRLEDARTTMPAPAAPAAFPPRLFVPQGARLVAVPVETIRWVEAAGDYATLHTTTGQHLSNLGITALQNRLDPQRFLRIHRSVLVALNAVAELERDGSGGYYATLEGGKVVRVSRSYADALRPLLG
ncbi:LytR/AlgR family response regulator transcription factor [Hymenobacter latericus]|uniref:LytR/AlgR family response regulator transcription factor n=1 Tax=Hymenobacter sp. YIM 151858-1 TaxID=2987688 RepID=UPI0022269728|nr:LytTR family DNA-binding domain-containing protein [Hymenobacter sp. YIM 151858-1]UYZ60760.1 LytTR family DNA-binding domain-containing protein [Hymenobacter sp. YIM 151858-1]